VTSMLRGYRDFFKENKDAWNSYGESLIITVAFTFPAWILDNQFGTAIGPLPSHIIFEWIFFFLFSCFIANIKPESLRYSNRSLLASLCLFTAFVCGFINGFSVVSTIAFLLVLFPLPLGYVSVGVGRKINQWREPRTQQA